MLSLRISQDSTLLICNFNIFSGGVHYRNIFRYIFCTIDLRTYSFDIYLRRTAHLSWLVRLTKTSLFLLINWRVNSIRNVYLSSGLVDWNLRGTSIRWLLMISVKRLLTTDCIQVFYRLSILLRRKLRRSCHEKVLRGIIFSRMGRSISIASCSYKSFRHGFYFSVSAFGSKRWPLKLTEFLSTDFIFSKTHILDPCVLLRTTDTSFSSDLLLSSFSESSNLTIWGLLFMGIFLLIISGESHYYLY